MATKQGPPARSGGRRKLGAGITALGAAGTLVLGALPAVAALGHVGPGVEISGVLTTGKAWLGAVEGTGEAEASGWLSWCITAGYDAPAGGSYTAVDYVDDPKLAWVIGTYESVGTEVSRAAISYLVHTRHETGTGSVSAASRIAAFVASAPQAVKDQAAAYLADAAAQAGPYSAADGVSEYTTAQRAGAVTVHPLTSASGTPQVGKQFVVTLNGPAVFDTNNNGVADPGETNVYTGTTQATDIRLPWAGTGNGEVTGSISYGNVGRVTLTKYSSTGQIQDTLTYGNRAATDPEEITVPGPTFDVVMDFAVVGTSQVTEQVVDLGQSSGDTLHIEAAPGDVWADIDGDYVDVPVTATRYAVGDQPVTTPGQVPAGAVVLETQQLIADGPSDLSVTPTVRNEAGFDTWVWSTNKAAMPAKTRDYLRADWSDQYGLANETTSVRRQIEVDSQLSVRETKAGDYLVDDIWQDAFADDHGSFAGGAGFGADEAKVTHTVYFFPKGLEVTDENLAEATALKAITTDAENGFFASIGSTKWKVLTDEDGTDLPGTYVVVTDFPGDDRTAPFTSSVTDTAEQYVVLPEPLVVTTQIRSDREVADGVEVEFTDDSIVTGTVPDGGVTVTNDLHKWATSGDPVCTEDTLVAAGDPIAVTKAGTVTSKPVKVTVTGGWSYGYVETVRNDAGQVVHRGTCGAAPETVHVPAADQDGATAAADSDQATALAVTGGQAAAMAAVAGLLLVAGAAFVVGRRRMSAHLDQAEAGSPS